MGSIKKVYGFSIVFVLTWLFTYPLFAQQNLFNIPSGDITNKKKFFYQHQLNLYSDKLESKGQLTYGLGKGWDAGMNLVGKGVYFSPDWRILHNDSPLKGALYPVLMGTLQKQFELSDHWDLNLGTQVGFNLSRKINNKELNHFSYGIAAYHFKEECKIIGGLYKTNEMYVGDRKTFGVMLGYEVKISKRLFLVGDWVSGNNDASVAVLGGTYNLSKRVQICAGWQIPNPNTLKPMGLVLELNLLGWDLYE